MTYPIVDLTFWNPGDPGTPEIDALLADPSTPLAKHGLTGIASAYAEETGAFLHDTHRWWANEMVMKSLAVDAALCEVVETLRHAGVPFFVAKGPTSAWTGNSWRTYTDLDVYVSPRTASQATTALEGAGFAHRERPVGPLGGLPTEMFGGQFGTVVEVHSHVIDNLHRRFVAPVDAYLPYVVEERVLGVATPILTPSAHLALHAVHLGAGHRYTKLSLFRDVATLTRHADVSVLATLKAEHYLTLACDLLAAWEIRTSPVPGERGLFHERVLQSRDGRDPLWCDEFRLSADNIFAWFNVRRFRDVVVCGARLGTSGVFQRQSRRWRLDDHNVGSPVIRLDLVDRFEGKPARVG